MKQAKYGYPNYGYRVGQTALPTEPAAHVKPAELVAVNTNLSLVCVMFFIQLPN